MYQEYYDNDNYQDDMNYSPVEEYNWSPNLFAKIVSYLNESVSPDVIRLGIIAGIRKSSSTEDAPTIGIRWKPCAVMWIALTEDWACHRMRPSCLFFIQPNGRVMDFSQ